MAEATVENRVCNFCGVDVRLDTLFCYNCGSSVAPEVVVALKDKEEFGAPKSSERFSADGNGDRSKREVADVPIPKPNFQNEADLKSAAALRRKPKTFQPKRVEVVWEENENAPNGWFILAAILLALFAAAILYLAMYLK